MPAMRTFVVTQTRVVRVSAADHVDAARLAQAVLDGAEPKPGFTGVHLADTEGWAYRAETRDLHVDAQ